MSSPFPEIRSTVRINNIDVSSNVYIAFLRMHLLETMPSSLPKLLNAVKWSHHRDVSVVSYNNIVCTYINALCMCGYYVKLGCKNLLKGF